MAESSPKHTRSENTDIISTFPDHLLHHVLSFVPIKQAVATSLLLCKRFKPLVLTMPSLNLQDSAFPSLNSFIQFVDALLILSHSQPIKTFRLCCKKKSFNVPPIRINLWVNAVMSRKIEHLELYFASSYRCIDVPTCVFFNQTIRVLKLTWVMANARSPDYLPSLKVLHLVDVEFSDPESAGNFFNGCYFLEELLLQCTYLYSGYFSDANIGRFQHLISATVLQPVDISLLPALSNVKFLRIAMGLMFPNIEVLPTFHNLTELEFLYVSIHDVSEVVERLESFPKLEILDILEVTPGWGERPMGDTMIVVPQCVASNLQKFRLGKYKGSECEFELARFVMKNASDLRTISISCSEVVDADSRHQMMRRLSSCPRGSVNCRLFFN